jgi:hypothetical protein
MNPQSRVSISIPATKCIIIHAAEIFRQKYLQDRKSMSNQAAANRRVKNIKIAQINPR